MSTARIPMRTATPAITSFLLLACAAAPPPSTEWVHIVTAGQKETQCKSLGTFTVNERGGPDRQGAAMRQALQEVSVRGGNGMFVVSNSVDTDNGAALTAEALQCRF